MLIGLQLFVTTSELPNFRSCCCGCRGRGCCCCRCCCCCGCVVVLLLWLLRRKEGGRKEGRKEEEEEEDDEEEEQEVPQQKQKPHNTMWGKIYKQTKDLPIECAQGDQPMRCPNRCFCVHRSSAVPSRGGVFVAAGCVSVACRWW